MVNCYIIAIIFPKIGIFISNNGGNEGDEQLCYGGDNFNISAKKADNLSVICFSIYAEAGGFEPPSHPLLLIKQ